MLTPGHARRLCRRAQRGVTLIELLVTITLLSLLLGVAAPSFSSWIRNAQIRTVAESLQNGIRQAQAEAVRRNRQVVLTLTEDTPGLKASASDKGLNWALYTVPLMDKEAQEFIQGGSLAELNSDVVIEGPAAVCFNSAGRQVANKNTGIDGATCSIDPDTMLSIYDVTRTDSDRPLRVEVSLGGQVRMCDPAREISKSPDGCS